MKRAVTILVAAVLVVSIFGSVAAGEMSALERVEAISEYAGMEVDILLGLYDKYPDRFDAEFAEMLYEYFCLYRTAKRLERVEANMELRAANGTGVRGFLILSAAYAEVEMAGLNDVHRMWLAYRRGEDTLEKFIELVKIEFKTLSEGSGE